MLSKTSVLPSKTSELLHMEDNWSRRRSCLRSTRMCLQRAVQPPPAWQRLDGREWHRESLLIIHFDRVYYTTPKIKK